MKPILFNTQVVRAVLDGRKTVTRRAVKPQPPATSVIRKRGRAWNWSFWADCDMGHLMQPPYQPGDILWVRETWNGDWCDHYIYKADGGSAKAAGYAAEPKWRPSIHMPKEAARLFLRVADVRVERLQAITIDDVRKEGLMCENVRPGGCTCAWAAEGCMDEPCNNREAYEWLCWATPFQRLWDSTIKPTDHDQYGWSANPWVWVISFERISREAANG